MARITVYLDDEVAEATRRAAAAAGMSLCAWVGRLLRERAATEWPADVAAAFGTWTGFPEAAEIRDVQGSDSERERW